MASIVLPCTEPLFVSVLSIKKTLKAAEQKRPEVLVSREKWSNWQGSVEPCRLVFIDESAAKTNMTRLYGRSLIFSRCYDFAPYGHWSTTTMLSSLRLDGTTACMVIEGGTSGEVFYEYVREILAPTLKPGDIVVLDNLSAHKNEKTRLLIEEAGATIAFLPPYSPDLNPIEKMWSKVKQILRSTGARTSKSLLLAIGKALECVTSQDAVGWFASCGYMTTK